MNKKLRTVDIKTLRNVTGGATGTNWNWNQTAAPSTDWSWKNQAWKA
jgi:hypothetical protein